MDWIWPVLGLAVVAAITLGRAVDVEAAGAGAAAGKGSKSPRSAEHPLRVPQRLVALSDRFV